MTYLERTLCKYTFLFHDTLDDDDDGDDDGDNNVVVDGNHDDDDVLERKKQLVRDCITTMHACWSLEYIFFFLFYF